MALLSLNLLYYLLFTIVSAIAATYVYFSRKYKHWEVRRVPIPFFPKFPIGNFSFKMNLSLNLADLYSKMKQERFFGIYIFARPLFVAKDLELVKSILVKDFSSFHDRGMQMDTKKEPLFGNLFMMSGQKWRNLRIKLIPTFTTGKMRMMFSTLVDVGKQLNEVLETCAKEPDTEVKDIMARYTTDVISSCAFGIETNSLKNPKAEFRSLALELVHPRWDQSLKFMFLLLAPKYAKYMPFKFLPERLSNFFLEVVRDTMQHRQDNNIQRNDFLQLLIQLSTLGYIPDADNPVKEEDEQNHQKFTFEQATAQAFLFFFAGFETASTTMQFTLYELALNSELQDKVHKEVNLVLSKHGKELTYEAMQEMDLLDRVVAETLRKYPIAGILFRESNEEYPIRDSNVTLDIGTSILIPIHGIHHDPLLYPDPERFDPDRFLPEEKEKRHPFAYIPFGEGPRNCIGNRFALMQVKAGLIILLSRFKVSPSRKTCIPLVFDPRSDNLAPKGGMYLKVHLR